MNRTSLSASVYVFGLLNTMKRKIREGPQKDSDIPLPKTCSKVKKIKTAHERCMHSYVYSAVYTIVKFWIKPRYPS